MNDTASDRLRILVVDDNPDTADSLAIILRDAGHEAKATYHAKSAFAATRDGSFDVAIIDVAMPELDGYRLGTQMRQHERCKDLVLFAMTGYADDSHRNRAAQVGFSGYFVKPFNVGEILKSLALLSSSERSNQSQQPTVGELVPG